uniref:ETFB lysine methyltransferase n=1 Tax=Lotus japonicus TaxID=34305 RepID=I3SP51_LOTJA|nr:unknown [Lotus japonicus]
MSHFMSARHFLKHLTCTHPPTATISRRLTGSPPSAISSLPILFHHHKVSYQWLPHIPINIHAAAANAKFSTASSSSPSLQDKSLASPPPYLSVLIHCPKDSADVLAEALLCFGATSVSIDQDDVCQRRDEICISSIFSEGEDINVGISHAADSIGLKEIPRYEVKVNEENWMKRAQESFCPVEVTKDLWVVPKWSAPRPPDDKATNIILDPGLAFGTGEHATTKLCLLLLRGCVKGGEYILDYGTGTGILAIAALKFGAAFAVGVDIDSDAIASASENAALNNIEPDKMQLLLIASDASSSFKADSKSGVVEGERTCEIQTVTGQYKYDAVIANMLLNPLLDLADQIVSCAKPGAVIGLSGILSEQVQYIIRRYSPFLEGIEVSHMDEWACVSGKKK